MNHGPVSEMRKWIYYMENVLFTFVINMGIHSFVAQIIEPPAVA